MEIQMMSYSHGYVASVIHDNKPIREYAEEGKRVCRVPFGSEYKLRLKNDTGQRAYAHVEIDGTDVLPTKGRLLMECYQTIDLERFVSDLKKGNKFKFVEATHGAVQDPTCKENGKIVVTFFPEIPTVINTLTVSSAGDINVHASGGISVNNSSHFSGSSAEPTSTCMNVSSDMIGACMDFGSRPPAPASAGILRSRSMSDKGATVEGSHSDQQFHESHVNFKTGTPVVLEIWLKGPRVEHKRLAISLSPLYVALNGNRLNITQCSLIDGVAHITGPGLEIKTSEYDLV
jgi:hypothetical protein